MTTKEIADIAGVSVDTVQKVAREVYPEKFGQGKRVTYLKDEAISVMRLIRKRNFVELPKDAEVLPQTSEVVTRSDLAAFGATIVSEVMKQFLPLLQNQNKQIDFVQDYYSIKGYASKLGQQITFSEALNLGRIAGKVSREKNIEIRKVDDERFGIVNSYSIKVLEEVFQI